jgi:hypothetical protein
MTARQSKAKEKHIEQGKAKQSRGEEIKAIAKQRTAQQR